MTVPHRTETVRGLVTRVVSGAGEHVVAHLAAGVFDAQAAAVVGGKLEPLKRAHRLNRLVNLLKLDEAHGCRALRVEAQASEAAKADEEIAELLLSNLRRDVCHEERRARGIAAGRCRRGVAVQRGSHVLRRLSIAEGLLLVVRVVSAKTRVRRCVHVRRVLRRLILPVHRRVLGIILVVESSRSASVWRRVAVAMSTCLRVGLGKLKPQRLREVRIKADSLKGSLRHFGRVAVNERRKCNGLLARHSQQGALVSGEPAKEEVELPLLHVKRQSAHKQCSNLLVAAPVHHVQGVHIVQLVAHLRACGRRRPNPRESSESHAAGSRPRHPHAPSPATTAARPTFRNTLRR
eukprot:Opistho-1_new@13895